MSVTKPNALLIGEKAVQQSRLSKHLSGKGCECTFAVSFDQACSCIRTEPFNLVFSPLRLSGISFFPLMDLIDGSEATLFYSLAVETGSWWLLAMLQGERCFGSSCLRPVEFLALLDELIAKLWLNHPARSDAKVSPVLVLTPTASQPDALPPQFVGNRPLLAKRKGA